MATCAHCHAEAPDGARFCPACGARLEEPHETRKVVTLVFSDWVGSTAIGERLDAESLRRVQAAYFDDARRVLERHGGTVEKFVGDAVMAVFGVPQAREDDALRAVRAAVELREALAALNARLRDQQGIELSVRTGVNTGEVVAGDPSEGQAFVTGDAVVVARRLEQAAAPGEILVGEVTRSLVRDAALVEPVDALELKGKAERVPAWRLLGVVRDAPPFARRLDAALVGRRLELAILEQAFERAATEGTGHFFTLLGAAGVGKSRLLQELLNEVGERATVLRGRCLPYGEGITFWPLLDVVRGAAGIDRRAGPDEARRRIEAVLGDDADAASVADRVAAAVGLSEQHVSSEETFWATRRLLEALARQRPVVLAFDDVHWGEPTFLDLVDHLGDRIRDAPILLVCLARPELVDERPTWGGGKLNSTTVLLEPLSRAEAGELVAGLLGEGGLDDAVVDAITRDAEGNPLFIEETVSMLVEEGALSRERGGWRMRRSVPLRVPPTIQALLAARLDRLPADEREVIETAAVMGKVFRRTALSELVRGTAAPEALDELVRKELLRPVRGAEADGVYQFRHILLQDAAYHAIPKERRASVHERFAAWVERAYGERLPEIEDLVGYHLEQAFRLRSQLGLASDELAARAVRRLGSAGRRALARGDLPAATSLLTRAAELPGETAARAALLVDLATARREAGDLDSAERAIVSAEAEADASADAAVAAAVSVAASDLLFFADPARWQREVEAAARDAIAVLDAAGDDRGLAAAWMQLTLLDYARCRAADMEIAAEQALAHARAARDGRSVSEVLRLLTRGTLVGPLPVPQAIERCERVVRESDGDRVVEATALSVQAALEAARGDLVRARELCARSRAILEDLGYTRLLAVNRTDAGVLELTAGSAEAAERELRASLDAQREIGDLGNAATTAAHLAEALEDLGRPDEALELTALSERLASPDDMHSAIHWRFVRARLEARRGQLAEALRLATAAVALAERTDHLTMHADALRSLAFVLAAHGRAEDASSALGRAIALYEAKGNVAAAQRAAALEATAPVTAPAPPG